MARRSRGSMAIPAWRFSEPERRDPPDQLRRRRDPACSTRCPAWTRHGGRPDARRRQPRRFRALRHGRSGNRAALQISHALDTPCLGQRSGAATCFQPVCTPSNYDERWSRLTSANNTFWNTDRSNVTGVKWSQIHILSAQRLETEEQGPCTEGSAARLSTSWSGLPPNSPRLRVRELYRRTGTSRQPASTVSTWQLPERFSERPGRTRRALSRFMVGPIPLSGPQQRLAAGEPDLADAQLLDADPDQAGDLVVGQHRLKRALVLGGGGSAGNAWLIGVIAGLSATELETTSGDERELPVTSPVRTGDDAAVERKDQIPHCDVRQATAEFEPLRLTVARRRDEGTDLGARHQRVAREENLVDRRIREVAGHVPPGGAAVVGLEHVPISGIRDPAPAVGADTDRDVSGVQWVHRDRGDVAVGNAGETQSVPRAAVVGGQPAVERRRIAEAAPGGVGGVAIDAEGTDLVAVTGVVDLLPVTAVGPVADRVPRLGVIPDVLPAGHPVIGIADILLDGRDEAGVRIALGRRVGCRQARR